MKEMNTIIESLGTPRINSDLREKYFINDEERILFDVTFKHYLEKLKLGEEPVTFERAGARDKIFFKPSDTTAAIVTCGGLCPGLNSVICSLVMQLHYVYGVNNILGIQYGYLGLNPDSGYPPITLTPKMVEDIHNEGGTILGSSRGPQDVGLMVDTLVKHRINILFAIGGDGTLRGASQLAEEIRNRGLKISVIGIPKTIDNDLSYIAKSFGFETAFSMAAQVIQTAHTEARGYPNGIGIVKLMGRHSGFITVNASLAMNEANYVLIPEVDFDLEGERGLLNVLKQRLKVKDHAVIVVAEGAGQKFFHGDDVEKDASGNLKLNDIGQYLKSRISDYFKKENVEISIKYFDPSYYIRSVPGNPNDKIFCELLAHNAVHAGMAGKTNMVIGIWNNIFVHIPISLVVSKRKQVSIDGKLWLSTLESTGQPSLRN